MGKKSQIWIETAIYTLIGLTITAILLSIAMPQIEKAKDKGIIRQTINALETLNSKLSEVEQSPGNIRIIEFGISKGKLEIDSKADSVKYFLEDTKLELSEVNTTIREGDIFIKTGKYGSYFSVSLTLNYTNLNITYDEREELKVFQTSTQPYKI